MKRLLLILGLILIVGTLSAQNEYKYLMKLYGGVQIGLNGTGIGSTFVLDANSKIKKIDSLTVDNMTTPTAYAVVIARDTLNPIYSTSGQGSLFDYAARKYLVDTTSLTSATYSLVAADAGKVIYCSHATFQEITIPANATTAIPVGTIITFVKTGAGPVRLTPAANVIRKSVLDSTTMNTVNQTYQIIKRATNKWYFIGNWID